MIAYCDLYDAFFATGDGVTDLFLPGDSVHFTPAGHRLIASEVATCLARRAE